jgi:hypothetical protein
MLMFFTVKAGGIYRVSKKKELQALSRYSTQMSKKKSQSAYVHKPALAEI